MLRRRVSRTVSADGVPFPLTDEHDPVWRSAEATAAFLDGLGVQVRVCDLNVGPVTRRKAAALAWEWSAGITRRVEWGNGIALDWDRLRGIGVDVSGSARERLKFLNSS